MVVVARRGQSASNNAGGFLPPENLPYAQFSRAYPPILQPSTCLNYSCFKRLSSRSASFQYVTCVSPVLKTAVPSRHALPATPHVRRRRRLHGLVLAFHPFGGSNRLLSLDSSTNLHNSGVSPTRRRSHPCFSLGSFYCGVVRLSNPSRSDPPPFRPRPR